MKALIQRHFGTRSVKKKLIYRHRDNRVIKRFAWFPITCTEYWNDRKRSETRWLQTVYVRQTYKILWTEAWWVNDFFAIEAEYEAYLEEVKEILRKDP